MIRKTLISLFLVCSIYGAKAQLLGCGVDIPKSQLAFDSGETLSYNVNYTAAIINAEVADITFTTKATSYMGRECYKIEAVGTTRPFYSIFFTLHDTYTTWVEQSTLRPIKATSLLHEGNYRYRTAIDFDWNSLKARSEGQNINTRNTKKYNLNLNKCSYDAISLFFNMRSADLSKLRKGENQVLSLVLEDTVRSIRFRYLNEEIRKIGKVGECRTLKFACQFATSNDESFKDGAEFFLWLSNDDNRIPIYLESPIRVGKVSATIKHWSGLKHPFSSLIVNERKK